ncbi:MAG: radical SAM protein [Bacteroidota bacterium]|nr:radical SAM protein [Bacteroidota bacterium]
MICDLCPRQCKVDRKIKKGFCGADDRIKINLYDLHFGEEPIISAQNGSGAIFFSHCNLRCVFCQNYLISDLGHGDYYSVEDLANIMLTLQGKNAHNINLVTPTHYTDSVIEAIILAKNKGLKIPIIWNTNGYENAETLKLLENLVDVFLPDFKYFDSEYSIKFSRSADYPEKAKSAIIEMYRQVGNIELENNLVKKGLMIRLLILPENFNSIEKVLNWIKQNIGNKVYISLMAQYYPIHKSSDYPEINRPINKKEYNHALDVLFDMGFENGFIQEFGADNKYIPHFRL